MSASRRLADHLVVSGAGRRVDDLVAATDGRVEGYLATGDIDRLIDAYALGDEGAGEIDVVLRATSFDLDVVRTIAKSADALAAVDLATSLNSRERTTGLQILTTRLETFA